MPQVAIRGIYQDGKVIPLEEVPFKEPQTVIIVFQEDYADESRYDTPGWQLAERQASEDYQAGRVESAESVEEMFRKIECEEV